MRARTGKQYVVLVATGGSFFDMTAGDSVFAYALPGGLPYADGDSKLQLTTTETPASQPQSAQTTPPGCELPRNAGWCRESNRSRKMCGVPCAHRGHLKACFPQEWDQVVNQMVSRGADLSDDDIDTVIEYLTKNYGPLDQMTTPPAGARMLHTSDASTPIYACFRLTATVRSRLLLSNVE